MSSALWNMTSTISTALSSKSTNPSSFSGAVDIIIVKHADDLFKSTPFHVRFGRYLAECPFNLKVNMSINDEKVDNLCMTLNKNGIAHFDGPQKEEKATQQEPIESTDAEEEKATTIATTTDDGSTPKTDNTASQPRKRDKLKAFAKSSWAYWSGSEEPEATNDADGKKKKKKKRDIVNKYIKDTLKSQLSDEDESPVNNIPTNDMIQLLIAKLKYGKNKVVFTVETASKMDKFKKKLYKKSKTKTKANENENENDSDNDVMEDMPSETPDGSVPASASEVKLKERNVCGNIYLWNATEEMIICDVDGTITKSDVGGHILPRIGFDYVQTGICKLLNRINSNGYRIIYLTARGIGQSSTTRNYLFEEVNVPSGAVICSPSTTRAALYREVIERRPQDFKIPTLECINHAFHKEKTTFIAGFGNRDSDAKTYAHFGIDKSMIFIIGSSDITQKKEQKDEESISEPQVTATYIKDYNEIFQNVNQLFPKLNST